MEKLLNKKTLEIDEEGIESIKKQYKCKVEKIKEEKLLKKQKERRKGRTKKK